MLGFAAMATEEDYCDLTDDLPKEALKGQKTLHSFFKLPTKPQPKPDVIINNNRRKKSRSNGLLPSDSKNSDNKHCEREAVENNDNVQEVSYQDFLCQNSDTKQDDKGSLHLVGEEKKDVIDNLIVDIIVDEDGCNNSISCDKLSVECDVSACKADATRGTSLHSSKPTENDILPSEPPKGCTAITKFFTAANNKASFIPNTQKEGRNLKHLITESRKELIIVAEVHTEPNIQCNNNNSKTKKTSCRKLKKSSKPSSKCNGVVSSEDVDMTIQLLETSYITVKNNSPTWISNTQNKTPMEVGSIKEDGKTDSTLRQQEEQPKPCRKGKDDSQFVTTESVADSEAGKSLKKRTRSSLLNVDDCKGKQHSVVSPDLNSEVNILKDVEKSTLKVPEKVDTIVCRDGLAAPFASTHNSICERKTAQTTLDFSGRVISLQRPQGTISHHATGKSQHSKKANKSLKKSTMKHVGDRKPSDIKNCEILASKENSQDNTVKQDSDCEEVVVEEAVTPRKKRVINGVYSTGKSQHSKKANKSLKKCAMKDIGDGKPSDIKNCEILASKENSQDNTVKQDSDCEEVVVVEEAVTPRKKRVINGVYSTTMITPIKSKKRTPLKIKFTRIGSNESSDADPFTPKSKAKKQSNKKAQELLRKARKASTKRSSISPKANKNSRTARTAANSKESKSSNNNRDETSRGIGMRRSSRITSLNASQMIALSYQDIEMKQSKPKSSSNNKISGDQKKKNVEIKVESVSKQANKDKESATDFTKANTTKSKDVKMAPIFGMNKKSDPDVILIEVELTEAQKQAQMVRRQFLLSGVPQTIKKQIAVESSANVSGFPPLPRTSHVQQVPVDVGDSTYAVWHLPCNPLHKCLALMETDHGHLSCKTMDISCLTSSKKTMSPFKMADDRVQAMSIADNQLPEILAEISSSNTTFPVRRVYKHLSARRVAAVKQSQSENQEQSLQVQPEKSKKPELDPVRKRTKRKRRCDSSVLVDDNLEENKQKTQLLPEQCELLWTDKYAPRNGAEILGNMSLVKKVKSWLIEWKQRTDLEMKKMRKEQVKQARKEGRTKDEIKQKLGEEWWQSDGSDFDLSTDDEDSDADDNSLCNTMLITGPTGVGKTAMVYALSQELGYKVFEVNSSSKRSGKQILAQLQEATQSHQVGKQNLEAVYKNIIHNHSEPVKEAVSKPEKKTPAAFGNFFKKSVTKESAAETSSAEHNKKSGRGRKQGKEKQGSELSGINPDTSSTDTVKKGLHLSSVSVILFDEVDLAFEEDKGFWAAIQTFMSTTKRPIVLTTTDNHFQEKFLANVERVNLRSLAPENIATYLQIVCLVENLRTSYNQLLSLTSLCRQDLRKLLLLLQTWAETGGSVKPRSCPIRYKKKCLKVKNDQLGYNTAAEFGKRTNPGSPVDFRKLSQEDSQSGDEFMIAKPRKRARRLVIQDDIECHGSILSQSPVKVFHGQVVEDKENSSDSVQYSQSENEEIVQVPMTENTPLLHDFIFHSIIGASNLMDSKVHDSSGLQAFRDGDLHLQAHLHGHYLSSRLDLIHANLTQLLPLPKVAATAGPPNPSRGKSRIPPKLTRIINHSDLYDSEESDGSFVTLPRSIKTDQKTANLASDSNKLNNNVHSVQDKSVSGLVISSLNELASLLDSASTMDAYMTAEYEFEGCLSLNEDRRSGCLLPGQSDDTRRYDSTKHSPYDYSMDIRSSISVLSLNCAQTALQRLVDSMNTLDAKTKLEAEAMLAVPSCPDDTFNITAMGNDSVMVQAVSDAAMKVSSHLPPCTVKSNIAMDYMPIMRSICQSEQIRLASGIKRRFLHYLQPIVSQLRESTLSTLLTSFS